MLPILKMLWLFTLKVLLRPVVEVKILNLTGIEGLSAREMFLLFF